MNRLAVGSPCVCISGGDGSGGDGSGGGGGGNDGGDVASGSTRLVDSSGTI